MTWHPNTGKPPPYETVNIRQFNGMQTNGIRTAGWSWKLNDPAKAIEQVRHSGMAGSERMSA